METHIRATERHLPYGIMQCYLPPSRSVLHLPTPIGVEDSVDLVGYLYTEMVYSSTDGLKT